MLNPDFVITSACQLAIMGDNYTYTYLHRKTYDHRNRRCWHDWQQYRKSPE